MGTVEIAEEEYSDVSDGPGEEMSEAREVKEDNEQQEGGEIREVRLREPSVSPIESDQSESYEKAGTLEGLNPETMGPEEDFTSLSEEEEGEIKNYEKKKALKKKKKELQRKVRELERKVIEISPNRSAIDLNGMEEGEIQEEEKKKKKKGKKVEKRKDVDKDKADGNQEAEKVEDKNDENDKENEEKEKEKEPAKKKDKVYKGRQYRGKSVSLSPE